MNRDFSYRVGKRNAFVQYREGCEYQRVPEAHAREIIKAGAGEVVELETVE